MKYYIITQEHETGLLRRFCKKDGYGYTYNLNEAGEFDSTYVLQNGIKILSQSQRDLLKSENILAVKLSDLNLIGAKMEVIFK